jgi:hypothetical protein
MSVAQMCSLGVVFEVDKGRWEAVAGWPQPLTDTYRRDGPTTICFLN